MVTDTKKRAELDSLLQECAADPKGLVERSEKYYREQAAHVADLFCGRFPENRIILLAGPSSSGKTTTSLNLQRELKERGIHTLSISLDDFFKPNEAAPLLPDGSRDLETAELLDTELLEACFEKLIAYGSCDFPIFDFVHGRRSEEVRPFTLDGHTAVVIEGLHALNPVIKDLPFCRNALKLYISIKTEIFEGERRILSTRELRLIRRIIRDANFRGCLPERTLSMWKNVVRGEDRYIRPFRLEADFWLDSIHLYEPFVYRKPFLDLTREDSLSGESRVQVEKLAESLRKFPEMPLSLVPKDSLLREFLILP